MDPRYDLSDWFSFKHHPTITFWERIKGAWFVLSGKTMMITTVVKNEDAYKPPTQDQAKEGE